MRRNLVDSHHIGVFVVQVEQIDLVGQLRAVEHAFLDDGEVKAVGVGLGDTGPHAATGTFATDDEAVDTELVEMGDERCTEERAGPFLAEHHILGLGCIGFVDLKILGDELDMAALGGLDPVGCK